MRLFASSRRTILLTAAVLALIAFGVILVESTKSRFDADFSGVVRVAGDFTFAADDRLEDMAVVAQSVLLPAGVELNGDVAIIATSVLLEGTVNGDLTVIGGQVLQTPGATIAGDAAFSVRSATIEGTIEGDLLVSGEKLLVTDTANITGDIFPCVPVAGQNIGGDWTPQPCNWAHQNDLFDVVRVNSSTTEPAAPSLSIDLFSAVFASAILAGLTVLVVVFLPDRLAQIELTAAERARDSLGAFLAALLVAVGVVSLVSLLLALLTPVGLAALPVAAFLGLALVLLVATGLVVASARVGRFLMRRVMPGQPMLLTTLFGTLVVCAPLWLAALFPPLTLIALGVMLGVASVGTGAAILTRYGARPVRRAYFVQG
jgi:hypothetical protein